MDKENHKYLLLILPRNTVLSESESDTTFSTLIFILTLAYGVNGV